MVQLANLAKLNLNDIILSLKSKTCIYCASIKDVKDDTNAIKIVLPCFCFLCNSYCINEFFKTTIYKENNTESNKYSFI